MVSQLNDEGGHYSIFALDYSGEVGRYYVPYVLPKKTTHLYNDLRRKTVLSGNSAVFIEQIKNRISSKAVIGYREHLREIRPNREFALNRIISNRNSVVEPRNSELYNLFDKYRNYGSVDPIYAEAFNSFLLSNYYTIKL